MRCFTEIRRQKANRRRPPREIPGRTTAIGNRRSDAAGDRVQRRGEVAGNAAEPNGNRGADDARDHRILKRRHRTAISVNLQPAADKRDHSLTPT